VNYLSFEWKEQGTLASELGKPLKQLSVAFGPTVRPMSIDLWRPDGTGLRIRSEMHDVAERTEVGVLHFSFAPARGTDATILELPSSFCEQVAASKLLIEESGTTAESGVILSAGGERITIVAAVGPYCLAVTGLKELQDVVFDPEYPLGSYKRLDLSSVRAGV
jgi:hypothetical protein